MENILNQPFKIANLEVKNRLVMSPVELSLGDFSGRPTEKLMNYYEERAKGGVGLIIPGITRVNDVHGAGTFTQLSMSRDWNIKPMQEFVSRIHSHGTKLFIQLHHPGRQNLGALIGMIPLLRPFYKSKLITNITYKIAPSFKTLMKKGIYLRAVAPSKCEKSYDVNTRMRALSTREVKKLINQFVNAAERCKKAGVDGVQLHAAHGYLIQQFLSPFTNKRTDQYGGSFENRLRFLLEIIDGIQNRCGKDYPLIVRLSVDECYDRIGRKGTGYTLEDGVKIAQELEKAGIHAIDVSSAGYDTYNYWLEPTTFECGWRAHMAKAVKEVVKIPVIASNLIRSKEQAENQLKNGTQDVISMGRPFLADPAIANKWLGLDSTPVKRCICCLHCMESMQNNAYHGKSGECAINPNLGHEGKNNFCKISKQKTVVVIGAGISGLYATEMLAKKGYKVVLFEKSNVLGGQINLADKGINKEKIHWCVEDIVENLKNYKVDIRLNSEPTEKELLELTPYAVIVATGSSPFVPPIEGINGENVFTAQEILSGKSNIENKKVAMIGSGMTGLETAEVLAEQGNTVTVVDMTKTIAPTVWFQNRDDISARLNKHNVQYLLERKLQSVKENCVELYNVATKKTETVPCEAVVVAFGNRSENALYEQLEGKFQNVICIGDSNKPGRISNATHSAYETISNLL